MFNILAADGAQVGTNDPRSCIQTFIQPAGVTGDHASAVFTAAEMRPWTLWMALGALPFAILDFAQ